MENVPHTTGRMTRARARMANQTRESVAPPSPALLAACLCALSAILVWLCGPSPDGSPLPADAAVMTDRGSKTPVAFQTAKAAFLGGGRDAKAITPRKALFDISNQAVRTRPAASQCPPHLQEAP